MRAHRGSVVGGLRSLGGVLGLSPSLPTLGEAASSSFFTGRSFTRQAQAASDRLRENAQPSTPSDEAEPLRVFVVAGEPSGEAIAAGIMKELKELWKGSIQFSGVGGHQMQAQGLTSIFPVKDISVMGVGELLWRIPLLWYRGRQTAQAVQFFAPHAILTVDSKGFARRLLQSVRSNPGLIPKPACIHAVSPSFWAWKDGEASLQRWRGLVDSMLCILPWEPATLRKHGISAFYMGHPSLDNPRPWKPSSACGDWWHVPGDGPSFRKAYSIPEEPEHVVLGILLGSREQEVRRMGPIILEALEALLSPPVQGRLSSGVTLVLPTLAHLEPLAREFQRRARAEKGVRAVLVLQEHGTPGTQGRIWDAYAACDAAIVTSGSVVFELLRAKLPMAVVYRGHFLTEFIAKQRAAIQYASLPNIIAGEAVIPEALFSACTPGTLGELMRDLVYFKERYQESQEALAHLVFAYLGSGQEGPLPLRSDATKGLAEHGNKRGVHASKGNNALVETGSRRAARTILSLLREYV